MASPIKTIAILNAGDNIGASLLSALSNTSLMVTVISRLESKSAFDPTVPVIKTDYTLPSLTSAFHGQDAIISCLPMRAIQQEIVCIDAAIAAGVKWFVPSEWGCPTTPEMVELLPILGVKQKSVEYLRKKEKEGLNWTAVCPGLFLDWGIAWPFLGFHVKSLKADIWDNGTTRFTTSNLSTITKAVVNLLTNPQALEEAKNKYIYICTATTTQSELLSALERTTEQTWEVNRLDGEKEVIDAKKKLLEGGFDFGPMAKLVQGMNFAKGMGWSSFEEKTGKWNQLLGLKGEESVEETVGRVVREGHPLVRG